MLLASPLFKNIFHIPLGEIALKRGRTVVSSSQRCLAVSLARHLEGLDFLINISIDLSLKRESKGEWQSPVRGSDLDG
jgi:hypothetical protein